MSKLTLLSEWNRDLARAVGALGRDEFFPALIAAVRERVPIAYPQVWLYHRDLPPSVLYHEIPPVAVASQIDAYLEGPYREDPFFQTSIDRPKNRIYRLSRVTAGRLESSSYYTNYYGDTGTVDEAIFLSQLQGGSVINISMMRLPEQGLFSDDEYQLLYSIADPISELLRIHSEFDAFAVENLIQPGIDHQIDLAFKTFGTSMLSPRERGVLELMLRGYGTDTTADRLSIARETVRRHRKSIYRKLDVNSQTDLFSLFLNTMSCLGEAAGEDPLTIYMGPA
ncbi:LuxR C-terminal-related transcriptional regulator [Congregibacter brevis]|uniref:LuxR C-terminal-related transcriptional regulator n=1 Tax=Congregibacter brevis TaxID=3081201 RepID=A0ABZ0IIS4_9GAMM|nr:LuxR C-terminal-related transcriptional regulator [Congregibacter sp. IMCC45268]